MLFVLIGIVLGVAGEFDGASQGTTGGVLASWGAVIVPIIVGVLIVRSRRRWVCPICRTESLTRPQQ